MIKIKLFFALLTLTLITVPMFPTITHSTTLLDENFDSGVDSNGNSQGILTFIGEYGFEMVCTDDDSNGSYGNNADGVHISNQDYGNVDNGKDDLVLGAFNIYADAAKTINYHSSGIVCSFNYGVDLVRLFDTDDDETLKSLYAFDRDGNIIGQTNAGYGKTFQIDIEMTEGKLIHKIEFDSKAGTSGGSQDNTYFTIDDFHVEGQPQSQNCIDSDNDGVPDIWDNCPNTNSFITDNKGCTPDGVYITKDQASQLVGHMNSIIVILDQIGLEDAINALKISAGLNNNK